MCKAIRVAFDESTVSGTYVQLWYNQFKKGRGDVNDNTCPSRPSTSTTNENIEVVKEGTLNNRRITTRDIADDIGVWFRSCPVIFM